jgi:hypothetical protein
MRIRYKPFFENIDKQKPYMGLIFSNYKSVKLKSITQAIMLWLSGIDIKAEYYNTRSDAEKIVLSKKFKEIYTYLKSQENKFETEYKNALRKGVENNLSNEELPNRIDFYKYNLPHDVDFSLEVRKGYDILNIQPKNLKF